MVLDETPGLLVDARGYRCPIPVVMLAKAVREKPDRTNVRLMTTDQASLVDVPAWCRMCGHTYLAVLETGNQEWAIDLQIGAAQVE